MRTDLTIEGIFIEHKLPYTAPWRTLRWTPNCSRSEETTHDGVCDNKHMLGQRDCDVNVATVSDTDADPAMTPAGEGEGTAVKVMTMRSRLTLAWLRMQDSNDKQMQWTAASVSLLWEAFFTGIVIWKVPCAHIIFCLCIRSSYSDVQTQAQLNNNE